eukprot:gene722-895_t
MPFALKLFTLKISNSYFQNGIDDSFEVVPSKATQDLLTHHRMRFISLSDGYELFWLTSNLEDPLRILQAKLANAQLVFYITVRNPYVINFSQLHPEAGFIYSFSNLHLHEYLHPQSAVTDQDKVPYTIDRVSFDQPIPHMFGRIQIQLAELLKNASSTAVLPVPYHIHIAARSTIWRYHIIDTKNAIKEPDKVVIGADNVYFIYKGAARSNQANSYIYESAEPLELSEQVKYRCSLSIPKVNQKIINSAQEMLLGNLPLPDVRYLESNPIKGGLFYSNMVVYV